MIKEVQQLENETVKLLTMLSKHLTKDYKYEIKTPWPEEDITRSQTGLGFIWCATIWLSDSLEKQIPNFQELGQTIVRFNIIEDFIKKCLSFISKHPTPGLISSLEDYIYNLHLIKKITGSEHVGPIYFRR